MQNGTKIYLATNMLTFKVYFIIRHVVCDDDCTCWAIYFSPTTWASCDFPLWLFFKNFNLV